MMFMGHQIDKAKLMTMDEVVDYLKTHGENYSSLSDIRTRYEEEFGKDLIWNYQHCSDCFPGFFIVPVREGFLSLPYDSVESDAYEIIVADSAALLCAEDLQTLQELYRSYVEALLGTMDEMIAIAKEEGSQNA